MVNKIKNSIDKFTASFSACALSMVQLDVSVLTLNHFVVAAKTGTLTALAVFVASFVKWNTERVALFLTGLFTMIADFIIHPSHFGGNFGEAIVTGIAAMAMLWVYDKFKGSKNVWDNWKIIGK